MVSCLESSEERIIRKLSLELESRGLEIDTITNVNTTEIIISPRGYKEITTTVPLYEFNSVKNTDSLDFLISRKADEIQAWFELPEWDDKKDIFWPLLSMDFDDSKSEVYKQRLTPNYLLTFNHTNTKTHRTSTIGKRLLNHWEMSEKEFKEWSWNHLNLLYKEQSELVKTNFKGRELLHLKCHSEPNQHALIFSENFKKEASEKVGYPFYVILNMDFPVYILKKNDLGFLKESLGKIKSGRKQRDIFPTELITYNEDGIEVSEIE